MTKETIFKFELGQVVQHKVSKKRFVVVKRRIGLFDRNIWYSCSDGKTDCYDKLVYMKINEYELEKENDK